MPALLPRSAPPFCAYALNTEAANRAPHGRYVRLLVVAHSEVAALGAVQMRCNWDPLAHPLAHLLYVDGVHGVVARTDHQRSHAQSRQFAQTVQVLDLAARAISLGPCMRTPPLSTSA